MNNTIVLIDGSNVALSRSWRRVIEDEHRELEARLSERLPVRDDDLRGRLLDWLLFWSSHQGHRTYVVFDGEGPTGAGVVEWGTGFVEGSGAEDGDRVVERVAARFRREGTSFWLVTDDAVLRNVAGAGSELVRDVDPFVAEITTMPGYGPGSTMRSEIVEIRSSSPTRLADTLDDDTRARLERMRRGEE